MKLGEFVHHLTAFIKANPDSMDLDMVFSSDEEGNNFNPVVYKPSKGNYDGLVFAHHTKIVGSGKKVNAVCIN